MKYKREKDFLQILCSDWVLYLLDNVGWTEIQAEIIRLRYLQHKSILRTCLDLAITSATYARHYEKALGKLGTYLALHKNDEIYLYY